MPTFVLIYMYTQNGYLGFDLMNSNQSLSSKLAYKQLENANNPEKGCECKLRHCSKPYLILESSIFDIDIWVKRLARAFTAVPYGKNQRLLVTYFPRYLSIATTMNFPLDFCFFNLSDFLSLISSSQFLA